MKQETAPRRRVAALLIAAAALPMAPVLAQDTQTQTQTQTPAPADAAPPLTEPAPQAQEAPPAQVVPAPTMEPVVNTRPSGNEAADAEARTGTPRSSATATRRTTRRTTAAPAAAPASRTAIAAPISAPAPAPLATPIAEAPTAAPVPVAEAPVTEAPGPLPDAAIPPAAEPQQTEPQGGSIWPWLLAGLLALGAVAFLLRRRRRHTDEELYHEPVAEAPLATSVHEPAAVAPAVAAAPVVAPAMESGRPEIDLAIQPVRAGVEGERAVVEFALRIDNEGSAAARDVRISTWMFPAGTQPSEMENMLIKGPTAATLPQVDAGDAYQIDSAVALPTRAIPSDSVLPVVVAEARYRMSDGSEGRTSAAFAVGVPLEGELAYFDLENPSGLHEGVEAHALGDIERT